MNEKHSSFIGKFVCFGTAEGLFCWGKIDSEIVVNTAKGKREAFVLVDRLTGPHNGTVAQQHGPTTIRKEMLNLERDIFDRKKGLEDLSDDQLFLLVLNGEFTDMHLGMKNMMQSEAGKEIEEMAKKTLNKRLDERGVQK